jgi:hypothetical protein
MKKTLLITLTLLLSLPLLAQREETLFGRNRLDLTGAWYTNTNNFSFFNQDTEYFSGGSVLFEFNKDIFLGWAWQRLQGDALIPRNDDRVDYKLNGFMFAYAPNAHKVIHPRFSIYGGTGKLSVNDGSRERIFGLQPAGGLELNVFSWFRLGMEAGYRFVTDIDTPLVRSSDISSPFVQLQFRFGFSWWD